MEGMTYLKQVGRQCLDVVREAHIHHQQSVWIEHDLACKIQVFQGMSPFDIEGCSDNQVYVTEPLRVASHTCNQGFLDSW